MYDQASRDLGFGPVEAVDPSRAGAADVSFVATIVPMSIDGLGLSGHDDHTEKETADLRMLGPLTKRAAVLIHRLSLQGSGGRVQGDEERGDRSEKEKGNRNCSSVEGSIRGSPFLFPVSCFL
jgi:hypothetical protein